MIYKCKNKIKEIFLINFESNIKNNLALSELTKVTRTKTNIFVN